jgi:hypothetical protein
LEEFEDSKCILYFTCKSLKSTSQFFFVIDCSGTKENSSQVSLQARQLERHVRDQSKVPDNFPTASVLEHRRAETTFEGAFRRTDLPVLGVTRFVPFVHSLVG